jgi:uncharacterized repeat protein (TIGR01451 family)
MRKDWYKGFANLKTLSVLLLILALGIFIHHTDLMADPYPSYWSDGTDNSIHYLPVEWPDEGGWNGYTFKNTTIKDQRTLDPSHGGARPQNYVNVSSSCTGVLDDQVKASVYWDYDGTEQVLFYRWRVEQEAHNYATGPSPGTYSSGSPWGSALWTVLIDSDGDGYREFAMHLDGSSGSPGAEIDVMRGVYSDLPNNSVDFEQSDIHLLAHNPTAFIDNSTDIILNYQNSNTPSTTWPSGSAATFWDYGTTRASDISDSNCNEYLIDYQIPLQMLDASSVGGPTIDADTPIALFFAAANSLNNPFQKDTVFEGDFVCEYDSCAPFGDLMTLNGGKILQPVVDWCRIDGCGSSTIEVSVRDALEATGVCGTCTTSVVSVDFYYYYDENANGDDDDGNNWTLIGSGTAPGSDDPQYLWTRSWDSTSYKKGKYLIGVKATDSDGNVTYSYLTSGEASPDYANPTPMPGIVVCDNFINSCGDPPPSCTKTISPSTISPSTSVTNTPVTFTIEIDNPSTSSITVEAITDYQPTGFVYNSTESGTLGAADTSPTQGDTGDITWTWASETIAASSSETLVLVTNTPLVESTFSNDAIADITGEGIIDCGRASVTVGAPRLTISKSADVSMASPGDTITYTITYANDSVGSVTGTTITDPVPSGLTYAPGSASDGGTESGGTITWNIGAVAAGSGPFTVTFQATVDDPFSADFKVDNTATIDSNETSPLNATATVYIDAPSLGIVKDGDVTAVFPGTINNTVTFTINYENTSSVQVINANITDPIPTGFVYNAASPAPTTDPGVGNNGTVYWDLGNLASGATGSVSLTVEVDDSFSGSNPNTATLSSDNTPDVSDSFTVGVALTNCNAPVSGADTSDSTWTLGAVTTQESSVGSPYTCTEGVDCDELVPNIATSYDETMFQDMNFSTSLVPSGYVVNGVTMRYVYVEKNITAARMDAWTQVSNTSIISNSIAINNQNKSREHILDLYAAGVDTPSEANDLKLRVLARRDTGRGQYNIDSDYGELCVSAIDLVIDKQVDKISASPAETLTYTMKFSNPGTAGTGGAYIEDTIPTWSLYNSATLNGAGTTFVQNTTVAGGQKLKFDINSSDVSTTGFVNTQASGTLVITSIINSPLQSGIDELTNVAMINSADNAYDSDQVTTQIVVPNLSISKSADKTSLKNQSGSDTVTYTLELLNTGSGNATGIAVSDTIPTATDGGGTKYFEYVGGSASDSGTFTPATNTISWSGFSLVNGASKSLTFQMNITNAPPSGVTEHDNYATATDTQESDTKQSNTVTVSINANPNLSISKSATLENNPLNPGDDIEYTVTLQNVGDTNAEDVEMSDPIPGYTNYKTGTLLYNGASQTDTNDSDYGRLDAVNNSVKFDIGTMPPSMTSTMKFTVTVNSSLSTGTTDLDNTATGSASNTASKQASVSNTASANPDLDLTKTGPSELPYPLTQLNGAAAGTNTITVDDTTYIGVNDVISLNGGLANVLVVNSSTKVLTLDNNVTGADNDNLVPTFKYAFSYLNNGTSTGCWKQRHGDMDSRDARPGRERFAGREGASRGRRHLRQLRSDKRHRPDQYHFKQRDYSTRGSGPGQEHIHPERAELQDRLPGNLYDKRYEPEGIAFKHSDFIRHAAFGVYLQQHLLNCQWSEHQPDKHEQPDGWRYEPPVGHMERRGERYPERNLCSRHRKHGYGHFRQRTYFKQLKYKLAHV